MIEVRTGCRLHFGLMELAEGESHRFSGLGLMLQNPELRIRFEKLEVGQSQVQLEGNDLPPDLFREHVDRITQWLGHNSRQGLRLSVLRAFPFHCGLGTGTQLAASVAIGHHLLSTLPPPQEVEPGRWHRVLESLPDLTPRNVSRMANRGLRSAVGLHGFLHGGLILDSGYCSSEEPRTVDTRGGSFPASWRIVLLQPKTHAPIAGAKESELMQQLGRSANPNRGRMVELASKILAAAEAADFNAFTDELGSYMKLAGQLFVEAQGGFFNGAEVQQAAQAAEEVGLRGVGQSSWGPTIFGFAQSQAQAEQTQLMLAREFTHWQVVISSASHTGAQWRTTARSQ